MSPVSRFPQQFYEIAANEVAQRNVVRGIMAKAFTDAGGDEKKAIVYYIDRRAAQLAQEARKGQRQQQRTKRAAAKEQAISSLRQPAYCALSGLFGAVTLVSGVLTLFFGLGAIGLALDQAAPDRAARFVGMIISFASATVCCVVAGVCGYLTYRCIKGGIRK